MISKRNKNSKMTNGTRFFRNAIVLLGTFSMSLMPVYSCTSENAGRVVSQQSKKTVAKKKLPQRAAVKKKVTINPKNVMMVSGKKVYSLSRRMVSTIITLMRITTLSRQNVGIGTVPTVKSWKSDVIMVTSMSS